jgi:hypothetical protein
MYCKLFSRPVKQLYIILCFETLVGLMTRAPLFYLNYTFIGGYCLPNFLSSRFTRPETNKQNHNATNQMKDLPQEMASRVVRVVVIQILYVLLLQWMKKGK